jgi:two-component system, NarL family, invasion response regulator UvrY
VIFIKFVGLPKDGLIIAKSILMRQKILLAEDHAIVITGVELIFETGFPEFELEIAKNGTDLMEALKTRRFRMAIIDLHLKDGDSMHLITDIRNLYPELDIIVFSGNPEELYAQYLYQAGVKGYLSKDAADEEIISAVRMVLEGKTYISENYKNYLLAKSLSRNNFENPFTSLSQREMEVAVLLMQGKRTGEICQELNLQPSTVSTYKVKIFAKLNVKNVLELKQLMSNYRLNQ